MFETDDDKTQESKKWIENRKVHEQQSWNVRHKMLEDDKI